MKVCRNKTLTQHSQLWISCCFNMYIKIWIFFSLSRAFLMLFFQLAFDWQLNLHVWSVWVQLHGSIIEQLTPDFKSQQQQQQQQRWRRSEKRLMSSFTLKKYRSYSRARCTTIFYFTGILILPCFAFIVRLTQLRTHKSL